MADGFVFVSDLHLKQLIWSNRSGLKNDAFISFQQVVDFCVHNSLPLVLGGDVFDSPRPPTLSIYRFQEQIKRLEDIPVYWIDGNHDLADPSWGEVLGLIRMDRQCLKIGRNAKINTTGLDWRRSIDLHSKLQNIPEETEVLVMHQYLDLALPIEGVWNLSHEWVPEHVQLTLLGDYHFNQEHVSPRTGVRFVYNGSMCIQAINEPVNKSFIWVKPGNPITYERVPVITRDAYFYEIYSDSEFDQFKYEVDSTNRFTNHALARKYPDLAKPIVVITYDPNLPSIHARIEAVLEDSCHLWLFPSAEKQEDTQLILPTELNETSILATLVNPKKEPELFEMSLDMLETSVPKELFEKWRKQFGVA